VTPPWSWGSGGSLDSRRLTDYSIGHLLLTSPQTNPLHYEPHDYLRFTSYGLEFLAREPGFDVVSVEPLGGASATVAQMVIWPWLDRRAPASQARNRDSIEGRGAWFSLRTDTLSRAYGEARRRIQSIGFSS
jgi:hypothetical protein